MRRFFLLPALFLLAFSLLPAGGFCQDPPPPSGTAETEKTTFTDAEAGSPLYPIGSFSVPYTDEHGNPDTAVMLLTAIRKESKADVSYGLDVKYFRLKGGVLEEFDKTTVPSEQVEALYSEIDKPDFSLDAPVSRPTEDTSAKDAENLRPLSEVNGTRASSAKDITRMIADTSPARAWFTYSPHRHYRLRFPTRYVSVFKVYIRTVHLWFDASTRYTHSGKSPKELDMSREVHVKGYYRKDGTYVRPYTRSAPGTKK